VRFKVPGVSFCGSIQNLKDLKVLDLEDFLQKGEIFACLHG
jgi:hypothetical protein